MTLHRLPGHRQHGMVSVIVLMVLVSVVTLIAVMTLRVADTGVNDSLNQSRDVAALFLAESGLEYATQQLSSGAASCGAMSATQSVGRGSFTIGSSDTTNYDGVTALPAGECRVQVSGKVNNSDVTRTVQGIINHSSGASGIALDSATTTSISRNNDDVFTFPVTVAAGSNQVLVVGVVIYNTSGQTVSSVSYPGVSVTHQVVASSASLRTELWVLMAPTPGSGNVQVALTGPKTSVLAGAILLNGIDQVAPIDGSGSAQCSSGSSLTQSVTTSSPNAWVVDVLGTSTNSSVSAGGGQAGSWVDFTNGVSVSRIHGTSSTKGPQAVPGAVSMSWSWSGSHNWCWAGVPLKPANSAVGVLSWREVVY